MPVEFTVAFTTPAAALTNSYQITHDLSFGNGELYTEGPQTTGELIGAPAHKMCSSLARLLDRTRRR